MNRHDPKSPGEWPKVPPREGLEGVPEAQDYERIRGKERLLAALLVAAAVLLTLLLLWALERWSGLPSSSRSTMPRPAALCRVGLAQIDLNGLGYLPETALNARAYMARRFNASEAAHAWGLDVYPSTCVEETRRIDVSPHVDPR